MGNLYTSSLDQSIFQQDPPINTIDLYNPPIQPLTGVKYEDYSIIYSGDAADYSTSSYAEIDLGLYTGSFRELDLQYITSGSLEFIRTNTSLGNILFRTNELQHFNQYDIENSSRQISLTDILFTTKNFQSNDLQITHSTKQFYLYKVLLSARKLQKILQTKEVSRQVQIKYLTVANIQRITYIEKEPDKVLWMLKATDKNNGKNYYKNSDVYDHNFLGKRLKKNSLRVIGRTHLKGEKYLSTYGIVYTSSIDPLDENVLIGTVFTSSTTGTLYDTLIEDYPYTPSDLEEQSLIIENLEPKQICLQRVNVVDSRRDIATWDRRGAVPPKNRYAYWNYPVLTASSTNYNTIPSSNEILDLNYKKQV